MNAPTYISDSLDIYTFDDIVRECELYFYWNDYEYSTQSINELAELVWDHIEWTVPFTYLEQMDIHGELEEFKR